LKQDGVGLDRDVVQGEEKVNVHWFSVALAVVAAADMCLGVARAAESTNLASQSYRDLARQALSFEQTGRHIEAAGIYEQLVEEYPARSAALFRRLVRLYAEAGQPRKALEWAEKVMEKHPDPPAYLAGVHAMCGDYKKARHILEKEIAAARHSRRRVVLHWQLADVYEKEGDLDGAERTLSSAVEITKRGPEHRTAARRLKIFRTKRLKIEQDKARKQGNAPVTPESGSDTNTTGP